MYASMAISISNLIHNTSWYTGIFRVEYNAYAVTSYILYNIYIYIYDETAYALYATQNIPVYQEVL